MCDCGMELADTGNVGVGEEQMEVLKGVDVRCVTQPSPLRSARVRHRAQVPQVAHSPLIFARGANTRTRLQGRVSVRLPAFCPRAQRAGGSGPPHGTQRLGHPGLRVPQGGRMRARVCGGRICSMRLRHVAAHPRPRARAPFC
jgi:hypothetical protein